MLIKKMKNDDCILTFFLLLAEINNDNRTEWSLIWSVIIRVINNCLITNMITDRI